MKLDKYKDEAEEDEQLPERVADMELYRQLGGG
ncbi:hypothetical protein HD595_006596 [Nonomuraea roseoviolacea subsp. carminata]|uniref:Uncharacterized protein n=1 Tax=Nonomuraea roseoviolacea subsp. carminata TaxID=160689 RepID=A0ABT1K8X9_9ACTN|nr:hypothetical protein [Nonomuraea roseoviolacea subsp. carminata]